MPRLAVCRRALLARAGRGSARVVVAANLGQAIFTPTRNVLLEIDDVVVKPVRSTYLNQLVVDGADCAFVLSMATPLDAVIILLGIGLLALAQHFVAALAEVRFSVPLLFSILGGLCVVLTVRLSRRRQLSR